MHLNYEIPDEDFHTFVCAVNNALISINHTYFACKLGCDVPKAFEKLQDMPMRELEPLIEKRLNSLIDFYKYLESTEKDMTL